MSLSPSLRRALGDSSQYVTKQLDNSEGSSVQTQIQNARTRLSSVGAIPDENQNQENFLLKALDIISRPGYGASNVLREFSNGQGGDTPDKLDPLAAFWRGIKGEEKPTGKDVFMDVGLSGDTGVFGGEAKWYNPSPAGALGLALDIFNPLDPVNWIGFGAGKAITKGASKGGEALTEAFGSKASKITEILNRSAKTAEATKDVSKATEATKDVSKVTSAVTPSVLDDLGAETVGKLAAQVVNKVDNVDDLKTLNQLIQEGLEETGKTATSKLDYSVSHPISIGLQNPLSISPLGASVKLPGYKATGGAAKLPLAFPGKNIEGTFVDIPGSENVTRVVGNIANKIKDTSVGQSLGRMFSTVFVPNTVPASVVMKDMTVNNINDLINISKTTPQDVPLSVEELLSLQDELAHVELGKTFDYSADLSASKLKNLNKGNYFSVEDLAKRVGLKDFSTDEITELLNDSPFTKSITDIYDALRELKPVANAKELFVDAAKVRKVMDLMYEQIPEGAKPYFTGVLKSQLSDLYPTDITASRLGKNVSTSPLMAYEFNYKGVPISVVVNSGENFNVNAWARLSSTFSAIDELPQTAIQALKGSVDVSPVPIKVPDTSMTIGDTIVLGRIDKPTVAHEFGHIWDSVAGDTNRYTQAILSDANRFDNTITPDDLYSDYSRSIYSSDNTVGLKEDFADAVSDYLHDRTGFAEQYPARAKEIERVLDSASIPSEELAKLVTDQRKLAEQVSSIPRTETQINSMIDSVDKYAQKFSTESGSKAYQTFRKNLASLYEQTNWKTRQWQQQVDELFKGLDKESRRQIMDAAAQITGSEIPNTKRVGAFASANPGEYRFPSVGRGNRRDKVNPLNFTAQDVSSNKEFQNWFKDSKVVDKNGKPVIMYHGTKAEPFTVFNTKPAGDVGAHFGDLGASQDISGKVDSNIYPVYLSIKNPLEVQDAFGGDIAGTAMEIADSIEAEGGNLYDLSERIVKQSDIVDNWPGKNKKFRGITWEELAKQNKDLDKYAVEIAKKNGYDGLVYDNLWEGDIDGSRSWVAFEPNQIKSATGNIGTYSKNSPDILYADMVSQSDTLKYNQITREWKNTWIPHYTVKQKMLQPGEIDINPQRILTGSEPHRYQMSTSEINDKYPKHIFEVIDNHTNQVVATVSSTRSSPPNHVEAIRKVFQEEPELAIKYGISPEPELKPRNPLFAKQNFPVFMSKLQEVTGKMPNSMPVDQFRKYLNSQGVKKEELKWTFIDDLLEGKDKITKQEVQDWVAGNKLEVNEIWRTGSRPSEIENIIEDWDDAGINFDEAQMTWQYLKDEKGLTGNKLKKEFDDYLDWLAEDAVHPALDELENLFNGNESDLGTKFSRYTQPGGEGYTELIFTLPEDYHTPKGVNNLTAIQKEYEDISSRIDDIREEYGKTSPEYLSLEKRLQDIEMDRSFTFPASKSASFTAPYHWDDTSNPVAHTRFDTRYTEDGKKVLFIDEIQSDWHQHGRDSGYMDPNTGEILSGPGKGGEVADAPFKTNWDEYVQKRMLRYAADNGYDGIAWSTGKQQAERWGQSVTDNVDTFQYNHTGHNLSGYKNGERVLSKQVEPDELQAQVGSDIARRLLDETDDTFKVVPVEKPASEDYLTDRAVQATEGMDPVEMLQYIRQHPDLDPAQVPGTAKGFQIEDQNGNRMGYVYPDEKSAQKAINDLAVSEQKVKVVSGTNLTVGGEGMRKFYDQQLKSNMNKLGKKLGFSVSEIGLDFNDISKSKEALNELEFADLSDAFYGEFDKEITNQDVANKMLDWINNEDSPLENLTKADIETLTKRYIETAQQVAEDEGLSATLDAKTIQDLVSSKANILENTSIKSVQQGVWLTSDSRGKIINQSFPLYADNTKAPVDELTEGWSDQQVNALDNFLKWRNAVVKQYKQIGIPINELEKYVPFIPERPLKRDEADLLRSAFGTGVKDATADNFDTLMTELSKADPNLKSRTTNATRPTQVNKLLKKPWLTEDAAVAMNIRGQRAIKAQELSDFLDEFVNTYGLKASDLSQINGNAVPDGYTAYKVGMDNAGNKILQQANNIPKETVEGSDIVFLPQEMASLYNEYYGTVFNQAKKNGLLSVYDSLSNLYKKSAYLWNPGHIMRDFQGNVFNNYLMGVTNPTEYGEGLAVLRKAEGSLKTPTGELSYSDIYEQAQKMGIIDSVMSHELPLTTGKQEKGYSKLMRKATYATDGWTRMTGFVHNLKQGQSYAEAAATTKKYLFDYFDLTSFEKKVMRRIVPFYTWLRKNIPLQLETIITDPRIFARINDIQNAITGGTIDWDEQPDYIQQNMAIQPLGSSDYVSNSLPYQDLAKLPGGVDMDSLANFLSSVNPLIRAPIETITNQDWWTGEPLESYKGEQSEIPVLTNLLKMLGSDKTYTMDNRIVGNIVNNIPILTRAGNLFDAATGAETNNSKNMSRISTTLGGPSLYNADSVRNSADWQKRQALVDQIQRLKDQGVDVPTTKEAKSEDTSRYQRLKKILSK